MVRPEKITIPLLRKMKKDGEKIACLTAYDWMMASLLDTVGIDLILVGDSGAMVFAGHETTLPITMDQMLYHTQAVSRGVKHALIIADMPFLSYQTSSEKAIENAGRFLKEGGADGVKIEGGEPMAETIHKLVDVGIPVMGHLGLTPQSIHAFGGYRLRGKGTKEAEGLKHDAKILEQAGVFSIVLEKIPVSLAEEITKSVSIPTIGIGAGPHCDGQILVTHDMLGLFETFKPKFVRRYAELAQIIRDATERYIKDIKQGKYPSKEESY
ncbi:MAG: 3-methyl-2-oxobutanoate hydroxymethyltransferase [Candidatus Neomarinimicrobiota bacterium]|nr:MAG: 3-methyl-2-oxobutanoate hydroxymethyltransferase [Candidatus Neomarinimicrobiota bacterium]